MGKAIFILASIACVLLSVVLSFVSSNQVIENKCSEEDSRKKDMTCAHKFLEKMKSPSVNCSVELKKYKDCFKNFTLGDCFSDYLKKSPQMRHDMERMAGIKSKLHIFARMLCGNQDPHHINTTGLPDQVKHLLKCKPEYFDAAKDCGKAFHDKFVANKNKCMAFFEAKMCIGKLMKEHCTFQKPPPRDKFNPFCPNNEDPPPKGGVEKNAQTSGIFFLMGLAFYLFL